MVFKEKKSNVTLVSVKMEYGSKVEGAGTPKKTLSEESAEDMDELPSSSSSISINDLIALYNQQLVEKLFPLTIPKLFLYLSKNDLLNCRLICQRWKKGVEDFLESDNYLPLLIQQLGVANSDSYRKWNPMPKSLITRPLTNVRVDDVDMWERIKKDVSENIVHVDQFMGKFGHHDSNPFPARAVAIYLCTNEIIDELCSFLEKFGKHIWTLHIRVENDHVYINENEVLDLLWRLLKFVPNLKHLMFATPPLSSRDFNYDVFLEVVPVPVLNYLKFIEMDVSKMIRMVLRCAYGKIFTKSDDFRGPVTIFEKMKGLTRRKYFSDDLKHLYFHANSTLALCPPVKCLKEDIWLPLESISVQVSSLKEVSFDEILSSLVKFRLSLRQFTLTFNGMQIDDIHKIKEKISPMYTVVISRMKVLKQFNLILDSAPYPILLHQLADFILTENLKFMQFSMHFLGKKASGFVSLMATRRYRKSMEELYYMF